MPTEQLGPQGEREMPMPDRYLIIPLIVRLQEVPIGLDGKPLSRITPDHVIDFYHGMEQFRGELSQVLTSRG